MARIGLEERAVQEITDRAEITDAIYRYAAGLDFGDAADPEGESRGQAEGGAP